jgi:hypothetical protein
MSNGRVTIHIDGVKRLLTMKSKVTFRSDHIVDIKQVNHPEPPILRAPGVTFGHYVGGSYYDVSKHSHQFWDADRTIPTASIKLEDEPYDTIMINGLAESIVKQLNVIHER